MMSKQTKENSSPKCDWCFDSKQQEIVGEDWGGFIWVCRRCGHEYVVPGETETGRQFWENFEEWTKKLEQEVLDITRVSTADITGTSKKSESED